MATTEDAVREAERRIAAAAEQDSEGLDLSRLGLTEVPESIGQLTALTALALADNQLTAVPESIGQLTALTTLHLAGNRLTVLPESIGQLTALTTLYLSRNKLTVVPEPIGQLTALTELHLSSNKLTVVPEWIGQLTALTTLHLAGNRLTVLPESIGQLTALARLVLSGNRLRMVPESIGQLTALTTLHLAGNENLSSPPPEIVAQGTEAVLAFLRGLSESAVERWQSKVLIVGEAAVGKTSLSRQLFCEKFNPDERQTHGVRVRTLDVAHPDRAGVGMKLGIWDFGGQLEYRATQRFYLTDRSLFLVAWNSRARAADGKVTAWLEAIKVRAPGSPVLLVATHGAEDSPAALPRDLGDRYPNIVGTLVIDSRTGLGIEELQRAIARHAADLPLMGARWPAAWDAAARALGEEPGLTITRRRAFDLMEQAGVHDPGARENLARMLHDLGQVAYFAGLSGLDEKIILKPEWLDARITQVIDSQDVTARDGVLSRAERRRLWGDLADDEDDPDLPDRLIRMMETFDLAYRTGDAKDSEDVAIIVDRLPEIPPPGAQDQWEDVRRKPGMREIGITYKLGSRQAGIPTWFIAREHRYTTGLHSRHGTLLHDRDPDFPAWAWITDDGSEQPAITLRVAGTHPVRFLSVLAEALDTIINDRYGGLIEERLVPCACQDGDGGWCSHAFPLKLLVAEASDDDPGAGKVRCPESGRRIEAGLMLDGLRGTGLTSELGDIRDSLSKLRDGQDDLRAGQRAANSILSDLDRHSQEILNGIRALSRDRATTGVSCPALLTVSQDRNKGLLRRARLTITLWCEWPESPHPLDGENGSYTVLRVPETLTRYLPYLHGLIIALSLAAPALGSVGIELSSQVKDQVDAATRTLTFIEKHVGIAAEAAARGSRSPEGLTIRAESGADFRALRKMLHDLDPAEKWGDLSPKPRPEGHDTIWLCPSHLRALDHPYTPDWQESRREHGADRPSADA